MSSTDSGGRPAPSGFFKGVTFIGLFSASVGVFGTLITAYFQNLSAYEDKVTVLAKDDMAAATQEFKDAATALSAPLSLQERLVFGYAAATEGTVDSDDTAYVTKSVRTINKNYEDAYTALRENINLIAGKMEIYLDWPSDIQRDPAKPGAPTADPINLSVLGAYNFDCDKDEDMPFAKDKTTLSLKDPKGKSRDLTIDWNSAKHHVFTIAYCFEFTHKQMETVRQWASNSPVDRTAREQFVKQIPTLTKRLDNQVVRLNIFMSVAMNEMDRIRVKYRPSGYWCSVPIVREVIIGQRCMPVRVAMR